MFKKITGIIFLGLVIINLYLFVSGIKLSDNIAVYEGETTTLHEQNIELQKQVAQYDSFQFAASAAAQMNFTKQSSPVYLDGIKYALNR